MSTSMSLAAARRGLVGAPFDLMRTLVILVLMTYVVSINNVQAARLTQSVQSTDGSPSEASSSTAAVIDSERTILGLPASKLVMVTNLQHRIEMQAQPPTSAQYYRFRNMTTPADDDVALSMHDEQAAAVDQLNGGLLAGARIVDVGMFAGYFSMFYYMEMDVGEPPVRTSFMFDTGSSLTLVQSLQCGKVRAGFSEKVVGPVYNKTQSSSFVPFGCPSRECSAMSPISKGCNDDGECKYSTGYAGGAHSSGILGLEKFSFGGFWFKNIPLGCVQEAAGLDRIAGRGLMGWGSQAFSMPGRLRANIFYCLPKRLFDGKEHKMPGSDDQGGAAAAAGDIHDQAGSSSSSRPAPGSGTAAGRSAAPEGVAGVGDLELPESTILTRLINHQGQHRVAMTGISIDGAPLPLSLHDFNKDPQLGTLLDTGVYLSRLPSASVYAVVRDAFRQAAKKRGLMQANTDRAPVAVDTCYVLDHPGPTHENTPSMDFHFEGGATISLPPQNILYRLIPNRDFYCFTFNTIPDKLQTVIGNQHLASFLVSINVQKSTVGFTPNKC